MEKRYEGKWSTSMLADCCSTLFINAPEQLFKRQAKQSRKQKRTFIVKCLLYIFLKYVINVCGFLRNRSQFCVFLVIFVLSASKLIRNCYYYLRSIKSIKICCPVLSVMMQHRLPVYTTWHYCDARSKYLITRQNLSFRVFTYFPNFMEPDFSVAYSQGVAT